MTNNKTYMICYTENMFSEVKRLTVSASSKEDAYDKAMDKLNYAPYAVWVDAVTYKNGNQKVFNTFPGKPY